MVANEECCKQTHRVTPVTRLDAELAEVGSVIPAVATVIPITRDYRPGYLYSLRPRNRAEDFSEIRTNRTEPLILFRCELSNNLISLSTSILLCLW